MSDLQKAQQQHLRELISHIMKTDKRQALELAALLAATNPDQYVALIVRVNAGM